MKKMALGAIILGSLLGGCQSDENKYYDAPKALDKMSKDELCAFYGKYTSNPDLSPHARTVALEQMRTKGCAAT